MVAYLEKLAESTLNCVHTHSAIPLPNQTGTDVHPQKRRIKNAHRTVSVSPDLHSPNVFPK